MASQYKLSYFNSKGLAEPARLLLAHAKVEYEDNRVEKSDWPALKETEPWGKLPALEVLDGSNFKLTQSVAILQYLAKKHGYLGANDEENATCAEIVGAMGDLRQASHAYIHENNEEKKLELGKKLLEETLPFYLTRFSSLLEKTGYFVGGSLTYADICVAHSLQMADVIKVGLLESYPVIKTHQSTVFGSPGIKEWVETRPVTQF